MYCTQKHCILIIVGQRFLISQTFHVVFYPTIKVRCNYNNNNNYSYLFQLSSFQKVTFIHRTVVSE